MASLEGLHPFPTGWYAIAFSSELAPGQVRTVHYLGKDIVLYRTEAGEAVAVEPFCPHLGAHLGHGGTLAGEQLRCPFHSWEFDIEGRCVAVPGSDKIPRQARLTRYPIVEQNDVICVFHDATGSEPFDFPPLESEGFTRARTVEWTVRTHPQEVCENTVDMAHLTPIHGVHGAHVIGKPVVDGSFMNVVLEFIAPGDAIDMPGEDNDVQLDVILHGLGRIVARTHVKNRGVRAQQAIYCTPIDGERMALRGVVTTQATPDPEFTEELSELFYEAFVVDFAKDFPIWENKRFVAMPVLSPTDGPIGVYRRWTRQFYPRQGASPRAESSSPGAKPSLLSLVKDRVEGVVGLVGRARALVAARATAPTARSSDGDGGGRRDDRPRKAQTATPVLRVGSVREYFDTLEQRFVPEGSAGVDAVFQWKLSGSDDVARYAVVRDGEMALHPGEHDSPTVTIAMDADDYVAMVNGEMDGAWAFTSGRAKLSGSIPMALKMRKIFPA